ncbi:hypothetical protein AWB76_01862 [Caballeronia temeraria]|uniref:Uncharacterized protein n=1 Tax=Caballeronia temeraria TaxID=1777137 RepID=A0A158A705_9BURK|nr:hypothetical protein [Caballeronia temeraria]SAK53479.1 hypothetical protein AWB76_01862 [Caballeronia temeraria]
MKIEPTHIVAAWLIAADAKNDASTEERTVDTAASFEPMRYEERALESRPDSRQAVTRVIPPLDSRRTRWPA